MVAEPEAIPVTTPPVETVATPVAELAHVPEEVASESVVVDPTQTAVVPVIPAGLGLTVIFLVT